MESVILPFARLELLNPGLVELTVNEGAELSASDVDEMHAQFLALMPHNRCLLVNKRHRYSYTAEAQQKLARFERLRAIAIVLASQLSRMAIEAIQLHVPPNHKVLTRMFSDRDEAIEWLLQQQRATAEAIARHGTTSGPPAASRSGRYERS